MPQTINPDVKTERLEIVSNNILRWEDDGGPAIEIENPPLNRRRDKTKNPPAGVDHAHDHVW